MCLTIKEIEIEIEGAVAVAGLFSISVSKLLPPG
jgi:hypothetical protein